MNPLDLLTNNPALKAVLPVLRMLGLDPAKIANKLSRDKIGALLEANVAKTARRLTGDGWTPAVKASEPEAERQLIRAALYLTLKHALGAFVPKGANVLADVVRDQHDEDVVALVAPQLTTEHTTEDLVRMVNAALIERMF